MAEDRGTPTTPRQEKEPDKRPPWWKWLWARTGVGDKTLWDLLQLLVVPLALAGIGFWFAMQQDTRQQKIEDRRAQQAQKIENKRAEAERELAEERAQDEALQAYLSQMSSFLLEKNLRASKEDGEVRTLARARTLTVLSRLDPSRKADVMQFLIEAELVQRVDGRDPIVKLGDADLSGASLMFANLSGADLSDASLANADLSYADLSSAILSDAIMSNASMSHADLSSANLSDAFLSGASLNSAYLSGANLSGANLSETYLNGAILSAADLSGADLSDADLSGADLSNANLSYAYLSGADLIFTYLSGARLDNADLSDATGVSNRQLQRAESFEGAIMPNGQGYEDWHKSNTTSPTATSSASASAPTVVGTEP